MISPSSAARRLPAGLLAFLLLVLAAGCGAEEPATPAMTPQVRALMIQAQQAREAVAYDRAMELVDSAAALQPDVPEIHFFHARLLSDLGQFDASRAAYERVLALDPAYPGVWHNLANDAYSAHEYSEAIRLYRRELTEHQAPRPWRGIGRAYVELGKTDSARYAFERAVAVDSLYAPGYFSLALLDEDVGEYESALGHARTAVRLNPDDLDFRYVMAELMVKTGRYEEAIPHLLTVAEERPWHNSSVYNLGQAFIRTGRTEQGQALLARSEELRAIDAKVVEQLKAVQSNPTSPLSHAALGTVLRRAGRIEEAQHAFQMAAYMAPDNLDVQNNIANLYLIQKDTAAAIAQYRAILRQDSTFADVWINLGIVYAISGKEERARHAWQQALRHRPGDPRATSYLEKLQP